MREHNYRVYFMASKSRVLYIGMTNNLQRRVWEHQHDLIDGFSKQYRCHRLVYFESFDRVENAILREKQLKRWNRGKKVWLIQTVNPAWEDLSAEWGQPIEMLVPITSSVIPTGADDERSESSAEWRDLLLEAPKTLLKRNATKKQVPPLAS